MRLFCFAACWRHSVDAATDHVRRDAPASAGCPRISGSEYSSASDARSACVLGRYVVAVLLEHHWFLDDWVLSLSLGVRAMRRPSIADACAELQSPHRAGLSPKRHRLPKLILAAAMS